MKSLLDVNFHISQLTLPFFKDSLEFLVIEDITGESNYFWKTFQSPGFLMLAQAYHMYVIYLSYMK